MENIISKGDDKKDFGAVWCLKVKRSRFVIPEQGSRQTPKLVDRWIMVNPEPVTDRLGRQSGKFSFHPPMDSNNLSRRNLKKTEKLVKIIIRREGGKNPSKRIREHLGIMNVHHAALFPDADGVAQL